MNAHLKIMDKFAFFNLGGQEMIILLVVLLMLLAMVAAGVTAIVMLVKFLMRKSEKTPSPPENTP